MEKQKNCEKVLTKYKKTIIIYKCQEEKYCRCSSMVEPQPSKLMTWVRFPLPAPVTFLFELFIEQIDKNIILKGMVFFL